MSHAGTRSPRGSFALYVIAFVLMVAAGVALVASAKGLLESTRLLSVSTLGRRARSSWLWSGCSFRGDGDPPAGDHRVVRGLRARDGRLYVHARHAAAAADARARAVTGSHWPPFGRGRDGDALRGAEERERLGRDPRRSDAAGDRDRRGAGRDGSRAQVHVARRRHAAHAGTDRPAGTKNFDKTYPVDFYARRSEAWATIGVIPAGASLRDALLKFQTGQVVGYYNPANGQLVYIGDTDLDQTERFILAHELTHALDDQHFGLKRLDSIGARCDDEAFMAGLGAIEGSAQYFASQVLMRFPSDAPFGGGGDDGSLDAVPPFITALQLWPYTAGTTFIQQLDGVGGTTEVDRGVDHVPRLDGADPASGAVAERCSAAGGRAGSGSLRSVRVGTTWT